MRTWLAYVHLLVLGAVAGPLAAQNAQATFDRLIHDASQAQHEERWADMERCLQQAADMRVRPLTEPELRGLSWVRRVQGRPQDALPVAEYNYRVHRDSASLAELAATYDNLQRYADARDEIVAWLRAGRPGYNPEAQKGLDDVIARIGIIYECRTVTLDPRRQPTDRILTLKRGHCEHLACGMAALMRAAGIPARLVRGWNVGISAVGEEGYVLQHSICEFYITGLGWVPDAVSGLPGVAGPGYVGRIVSRVGWDPDGIYCVLDGCEGGGHLHTWEVLRSTPPATGQ